MQQLKQLKLRNKIGLSFGVLIGLIVLTAVVGALAALSITQQLAQQKRVEQVFSEIDKVRLMVSRFVNIRSSESEQQVFLRLATIRQQIEAAHQGLGDDSLMSMLPLLDDFKLHFQKYVILTDQKLAMESQAFTLGQRMVEQLNQVRSSTYAHTHRDNLDALESQLLALQWMVQTSQITVREPSSEQTTLLRQALSHLRESAQYAPNPQDTERLLLRIHRDASDYVVSFEAYLQYQSLSVATLHTLVGISDTLQDRCNQVNTTVGQVIQNRIQLAAGLMLLIFVLAISTAVVLTRYLTREILRPIRTLINVTHAITEGNLQARASVLVEDEIGELSRSFNQMTQSLSDAQFEQLQTRTALEQSRLELEQRVDERTGQLATANQALVAREMILRQIIDTAPVSIFLLDMTGQITQANSCMVEMFAYPMETLIGMAYVVMVGASEREASSTQMLALMNREVSIVNMNRLYTRANGQTFLGHTTVKVFHGPAGEKLGLVGVIADITERTLAEEKLKLSASVFTHAREGIVITDAQANIVDVNDTFSLVTGYSRDEVMGKNPRLLKSDRQPAEYYLAMWRALTEKGHWYGEIWNQRKNGELYASMLTISAVFDAKGKAQNYVALFSDITAIKEHQQQLEHMAHFDALTLLPNRLLLADRLQRAMVQSKRRNQLLAVAYLDLDGFKAINDIHGHDAGDELLMTLSQRMKNALREGDTLARIGGDEFVAVLVDLQQAQDCEPLLERLLRAASSLVVLSGQAGLVELQVSASIGVTLYPRDNTEADLLLRHADQAMYVAKQSGKNRYHLFDVAHDEAMKTQLESLAHVRSALQGQEFVLYYQPKVNMKTGRVTGAEALIRWQHPQRGLLSPCTFLPVIEDHPISIDVGEWVICAALAQMRDWYTQGLSLPVSVNIGAHQLQQDGFALRLGELLVGYPDVPPSWLQLEVLETSALEDMVKVSAAMHACHSMGVSFALDDFGTGYSSLTYLKRLPAETLKIDQSFVRDMLDDPNDRAIVNGVIGLAQAFGRQVIAEGVETAAHGQLLLATGCELAQGYGIAKPMPAAQLPDWVARWHQSAVWTA